MVKELKSNNVRFVQSRVLILKIYEHSMFKAVFCFIFFLLFASCANNLSAPVSERSEELVIRSPIIVVNSGDYINTRTNSRLEDFSNRNSGNRTYRVQSGDNLISIAFRFDIDFRSLAMANELKPPYTIFVDQELNLDVRNMSDLQSTRNNSLGVEAPNNSVARTQVAASSRTGGIVRESITARSGDQMWEWPSSWVIVGRFMQGQNKGIDISGSVGDPVFAANRGDVVYSGRDDVQGIGNLLIIRHGERYLSAYGHNSRMLVTEGDAVESGQKIAEVGSNSDGESILHFEIRLDGKPTDPLKVLPSR